MSAPELVHQAGPPLTDDAELPPGGTGRLAWLTGKRAAIAAAVVIAAGGASAGTYFGTRGGGSGSGSASPLSVTTQKLTVSTGTLKQTVTASGTLVPAQDSDLTFGVSGTVTAVDVTTGEKVTAGQTLATIDSTALSDQVAADQATVTADDDRLAADQAAGASASQIDSDQAAVTSAQSQLSTAETNLSDATLKATFDGTVASVGLAVGDVVSGGAGSVPASSFTGGGSSRSSAASTSATSTASTNGITVISADSFNVSTSVDDTEVGQVKVGDQAVITVGGSSNPIYGTVSSVSLVASSSSSSSVASFPVEIAVTGSPSGLYPGASAAVSIVTEQLNNVVEVPTAAISYTTGNPTVTEVVNGSDKTMAVTTGISAAGYTQITGGLQAGDVIMERVVKFSPSATRNARTLFGGTGTGTGSRNFGGGGLGGRNFGGGGFPGGGATGSGQ